MRRRKGGEEKKAMAALLVFIMATNGSLKNLCPYTLNAIGSSNIETCNKLLNVVFKVLCFPQSTCCTAEQSVVEAPYLWTPSVVSIT